MSTVYPSARSRINITGAGTTELVPALAGYKIMVLALMLSADGTQFVQFRDTAGLLTELYTLVGVPHIWSTHESGWITTAAGSALSVQTTVGVVNVVGLLNYRYIAADMELY